MLAPRFIPDLCIFCRLNLRWWNSKLTYGLCERRFIFVPNGFRKFGLIFILEPSRHNKTRPLSEGPKCWALRISIISRPKSKLTFILCIKCDFNTFASKGLLISCVFRTVPPSLKKNLKLRPRICNLKKSLNMNYNCMWIVMLDVKIFSEYYPDSRKLPRDKTNQKFSEKRGIDNHTYKNVYNQHSMYEISTNIYKNTVQYAKIFGDLLWSVLFPAQGNSNNFCEGKNEKENFISGFVSQHISNSPQWIIYLI